MQLDARSDLYSLALVLVESVTGRLPFAADTTLGTLTARTLQPIVATEELGPLEPVIERVGAIDPERSLSRRGARCARRISDAADALPPPGPLLLAGMVDRADPHPTRAAPVARGAVVRPGRGRGRSSCRDPDDRAPTPTPIPTQAGRRRR